MKITDRKTLRDIQQEFNEKFPYLKLEFYAGKHVSGQPSHANKQLDPKLTLAEVRTTHTEGDFNINGRLKARTLEDRFWEQYGLNVQVFRRSGNLWLQTITTDHFSLTELNGKGERSERSYQEMHKEDCYEKHSCTDRCFTLRPKRGGCGLCARQAVRGENALIDQS